MPVVKLKNHDYIYELISADGRLTAYQAKIRRKGFPAQCASFDDLGSATRFVRQVLGGHDRGHKSTSLPAIARAWARSSMMPLPPWSRAGAKSRACATSFIVCAPSGAAKPDCA